MRPVTHRLAPKDFTSIDISSETERRYWTREIGCSEAWLVETVARCGTSAVDVKRCWGDLLERAAYCEPCGRARA